MISFNGRTKIYKTDGDCGDIHIHFKNRCDPIPFNELKKDDLISIPYIDTKQMFIITQCPYFDLGLTEGTKVIEFRVPTSEDFSRRERNLG